MKASKTIFISTIACLLFAGTALSYEITVHNGGDCIAEVGIQFMNSDHNQHYLLGVDETITFNTKSRCAREIWARVFGFQHTYVIEKCLNDYDGGGCEIACYDSRWKVVNTSDGKYDLVREE